MRTLTALFIICCLTLTPFFPTSHAQKQDASGRKREMAQRLFQPEAFATADLTDVVSRKGDIKGKAAARSTTQTAPAGLASSVIASGQAVARSGVIVSHEATGPIYQKAPQVERESDEELREANPPIFVPPGDGKKVLNALSDPPTWPVTPGNLPATNAVDTPQKAFKVAPNAQPVRGPLSAAAPTDFIYGTVRDIPTGVAIGRHDIGEPSLANMGSTIFYTGNSYAARSADGGATFTFVSPFTTFPNSNDGFCCDQLADYAPTQNMLLWALQYYSDGTSNTLRLARAIGSTSVINNQWVYYNFTPQSFGFPAGTWLDFPNMSVATNFLYITANVFSGNRFIGSVVWRVRLTELAAGGSISYQSFTRLVETDPRVYPEDLAPRLTEGATTTMYWASHINTSRIRIFRWDDGSNTVFWDEVAHNPFTLLVRDGVAVSPDGTNWAARADSRILGAWVANGILGFMWGAKQDANFPYPYTIVARFNQSTRALVSQNNIWNPQTAWLIPTASVNASGSLAGLLAYGGGTFYPSTAIWISDDVQNGFNPLAVYGAAESNNGPYRHNWGDYHTVHRHKDFPNSWVASTYYMLNGGDDFSTVPRYLWFGRERDMGCSLTNSPESQSFSANGGTGSITVTASASACARTATSNANWLTVTSGASGTGSGTVTYSVAANTSSSSRTGTMTVAGRTFTVTQSGSSCSFSISPINNLSVGAAGANGSVAVTAGAGCGWSALSNVSWVSITAGVSGTGNGTVNYSVGANTSNISRSGTLTIAGRTFTITQAAAGGGCLASSIAVGQTASGTLSSTDCKLSDGTFYDAYTFSGTANQQVIISMSSSAFDTFLILLGPNGSVLATDDDGGGGNNSRIPSGSTALTLPSSGTYTILANSFASGAIGSYTLSLAGSQQCTVVSIIPGQTVNGVLGSTDCKLNDDSFYDSYTFGGAAGQQVSIAMSSSVFDTYLFLIAPDGSLIASDDDGGGGTNSRIPSGSDVFTLPSSGTYTVLANSFAAGATGGYILMLSSAQGTPTIQLTASTISVSEAARQVLFNVTRTGNTSTAASVDYATSDGTASRLRDYTQTLGTLAFAPGEATKAVTVFITDDVFAESAETFSFTLSNASGATLGTPSSSVVTINNDDTTTGANPVGDTAFNADFFVRQHYVDFLNREADANGLAFWTNEITQCGTNVACRDVKRINVSAAFFVSIEFQNTGYLVYRFYKAAYGDATSPNVPGSVPVIRLNEFLPDTQRIGQGVVVNVGNWQAQLEANKQAYALEFVQRARFLAAFPTTMTPAQFVDKLRTNTGPALTQTERDQLVAELTANNTTTGRASVLRKVAEDATLQINESNRAFVLMQYYGYLRRNPDDAPEPGLNFGGWKFWLDKLNQFNGNYIQAEMVNAFITSTEYRQRFGP